MAFDGKLDAFKKRLRKASDPYLEISLFKNKCKADEILKYSHRLSDVLGRDLHLYGLHRVDRIEDLTRPVTRWSLKPDKTLLWAGAEARQNAKLILEFVSLAERFEWQIVSGTYSEAKRTLTLSLEAFGYSLWYIENLIALLEVSEGLESQKALVSDLVENGSVQGILKYLAFYMSVRAERSVSPERYEAQLKRDFPQLFDENHPALHTAFKLNFFGHVRFRKPHLAMSQDDGLSIIDRYLTLVRVLQVCLADDELAPFKPAAAHTIRFLDKLSSDQRVSNLMAHLGLDGVNSLPSYTAQFLDWLDAYTLGRYAEVDRSVLEAAAHQPIPFDAMELAARARARTGIARELTPMNGVDSFIDRMCHLLIKSPHTAEAAQDLLKFVFMFPSLACTAQLFAFLMREYRHVSYSVPERFEVLGALNGTVMNPRLALGAPNSLAVDRLLGRVESLRPSVTCQYFRAWATEDLSALSELSKAGVPKPRLDKAVADVLIRRGENRAAEPYYRAMQASSQFVDYQDALEGLVRVYLREGEPVRAAEEIVAAVLDRPNLRGRLPIEETVQAIQAMKTMEIYKHCAIPILFDLHVRGTSSSDRDEGRILAYQEFLNANGVDRPSAMRPLVGSADNRYFVYFLRNVCIQQVMDSSVAFASTEELTEERIRVCQLLTEIDPDGASHYAEEIKALTQHIVISRGMHEIEKSKIYVDVQGVIASVEKECRQLFDRVMALTAVGQIDGRMEELLLELQRVFSGDGKRVRFSIPINERLDAFKQLFATVRNAFVSSNEYGLDVYISVGIRHGTLAGQLRSALEREALITVKGGDGKYKPNEVWQRRLGEAGWTASSLRKVQEALAAFSGEFDALIETIKNVDLQIKTEERSPNGILDFSIRPDELRELLRKISFNTTYDEVVSWVIEKLWALTDEALGSVRARLSTHKATIRDLLTETQNACNQAAEWEQSPELNDAFAKARGSLQEELDRIAYWFTRSTGPEKGEYALAQAIDIALQMVRYIYPKRSLNPKVVVTGERRLVGRSLSAFVGILFILLDNVVTKAGVETRAPTCGISIACGDEKTVLTVRNELGPDIDVKALRKRVELIAADIRGLQSSELVRKEGGSGLAKIAKILRIDCGCQFTFVPKVDKAEFSVAIEFTAGRLLV